jgi:hypothetical protein
MNNGLVCDSKVYNISTRGSACNVLNGDWRSHCEFDIPNLIASDESIEYVQFSVPDAIIPVSMYNVNEYNNMLVIVSPAGTTTLTFPYGNYNSSTFASQFATLMGTGWSLALNTVTNKFTVVSNALFTIDGSSTIGSVMGFSTTIYSSSNTVTMPRCCNFLPIPRVCIRCPELANTTMVGSQNSADIIVTIPNNVGLNGQIYYLNQSASYLLFRHHNLSHFVISITDDDGNLLNFNGLSCFFTFQFDIYRKHVLKPPRFSNIIEYVNNHPTNLYPDEEQLVDDGI